MSAAEHLKLYEAKINLRQFDEVAPLISAEAVFWFTDGAHRGVDEIRAAFERTWRVLQNEIYWLEDLEWIAQSETVASCIYRFRWKAEIDGKPFEGAGRGTTVLNGDGAGRWKIIHEHLSRFP